MCNLMIKVPDEVLLDLHEDRASLEKYAKLNLAMDFYSRRKVSLGFCADIAEMPKEDFVKQLGINGISIFSFESENELLEELANA